MEAPIQATDPVIPGTEFQEPTSLIPCSLCNRKFVPESLVRHKKACEKVLMKKRKQFDSAKQRLTGELAECLPLPMSKIKRSSPIRKSSRWKEKHLQLLETLRAAREGSTAPLLSKPADHEQCPHCGRSFGPKAFDRHVEYCKEKFSRLENVKPNISLQAKERLEARTKYRAPCVKSKRSITREKYLPPHKREPSPTSNNVTSPVGPKPTDIKRNSLNSSNTKENIYSSAAIESNKSVPSSTHNNSNFVRSNRTTSSFRSSQRRPSNKSIASNGASIIVPVQKPATKQPLVSKPLNNTQENAQHQTPYQPVLRQTLQTLPSNMKIKKDLITSRIRKVKNELTPRNNVAPTVSEDIVDSLQVEPVTIDNDEDGDTDSGNLIDFNTPRQEYFGEETKISLEENLNDQSDPFSMPLFDFYGPNTSSDQSSEHNDEALKNSLLDCQTYASSRDSGFGSFDHISKSHCESNGNDIGGKKCSNEIQSDLIRNGSMFKPNNADKGLDPFEDCVSCNKTEVLCVENTIDHKETLKYTNYLEQTSKTCQYNVKTIDNDLPSKNGSERRSIKVNIEKSLGKSSLAQHLLQEMERTLPKPKPEHVYQKQNDQSNCKFNDNVHKKENKDSIVSNEKTALYNESLHGFLEKSFSTPRGVTRTISRKSNNEDGKETHLVNGTPYTAVFPECIKRTSVKNNLKAKEKSIKKTTIGNTDDDSLSERKSCGKSRRKIKMVRKKLLTADDTDVTVTSELDEPYDSLDECKCPLDKTNPIEEQKSQMFELFSNENFVYEDDDNDASSIEDEELVDIANKMNQLSARKCPLKESVSNDKSVRSIKESDSKDPCISEPICSQFENDTIDPFFKPIDPAPHESGGTNQRLLRLRNAKKSLDLSKLGTDSDVDRHVVIDSVLKISAVNKEIKTFNTTAKLGSDPKDVSTIDNNVNSLQHTLKLNNHPILVPMLEKPLTTLAESVKLPPLNLKNTTKNIDNKATEMKPKRGNNSTLTTLPPLVCPLKKKVNSKIPKAKTLYTAKHYLGEVAKKTGLGNVPGIGKLPPIAQLGTSFSSGDGLCHVKKPNAMFSSPRILESMKNGVDTINNVKFPTMSKMTYLVSPYASSTMTEREGGGDLFGSRGNKAAGDSAYNSLNRKGTELASSSNSSGSESSFPTQPDVSRSGTKLSKFCHECGTQYPLSSAKFCCQCGVRRLVLA
ncbi:hypothetical protein WDU94_004369 [Cyamophila willieti]